MVEGAAREQPNKAVRIMVVFIFADLEDVELTWLMDGLEWDLEQCRVSEAEPMSKYGAIEMDCMKRFYVHSGWDKRIFIRLREHLHCRFYIARNARLKLLRIYFHGLVPGLGFAGLGIRPLRHNFCFRLLAKNHEESLPSPLARPCLEK